MRRKRGKGIEPDVRTPAGRVAYYLENLYRGNQTDMAESIGCSQSVVSKIVLGHQEPGRKVLAALADQTNVNSTWLYSGEGEPLFSQIPEERSGGWLVPLSRQPLPGSPSDHRELLGGDLFPVIGSLFEPTRYWLEVRPEDPITKIPSQKVGLRDLLLIETSQTLRSYPSMVHGRLCVVQVEKGRSERFRLGEVHYYEGDPDDPVGYLDVDVFDRPVRQKQRKGRTGSPVPVPSQRIHLEDIVGVGVMLLRRMGIK